MSLVSLSVLSLLTDWTSTDPVRTVNQGEVKIQEYLHLWVSRRVSERVKVELEVLLNVTLIVDDSVSCLRLIILCVIRPRPFSFLFCPKGKPELFRTVSLRWYMDDIFETWSVLESSWEWFREVNNK